MHLTFCDKSSPTVMIYVMYKLLFLLYKTTSCTRLCEFKKEPDDKPGYVVNDHLSTSAVASSL